MPAEGQTWVKQESNSDACDKTRSMLHLHSTNTLAAINVVCALQCVNGWCRYIYMTLHHAARGSSELLQDVCMY